jgi:hypothetical protein
VPSIGGNVSSLRDVLPLPRDEIDRMWLVTPRKK